MLYCYHFVSKTSVCIHGLKIFLQAQALKTALEAKNLPVNVYVGMRYWYPFTEEAVQQVAVPHFHFLSNCFLMMESNLPEI